MARFPTFEEYDRTGDYEEGIKRCDELLQRSPDDVQLLTTKLQLLVQTPSHSSTETSALQERLCDLPITDLATICHIEQAVLDSHRHTHPLPATLGPHISKLWSNALRALTAPRAKLELLSVRWERAVLDSRIRDMQETLIQFKAVRPRDRAVYLAHVAVTGMLARGAEGEMMGRIAVGLARRVVKEGWVDDGEGRDLDLRVVGQVFARVGARGDLEGWVAQRGGGESREVFEVCRGWEAGTRDGREGIVVVSGRQEAAPVVPDASEVAPIEWLGAEVATLKHTFKQLLDSAAPSSTIHSFAETSIRLFKTSLTLANVRRLPAECSFLAISALVHLWTHTHTATHLLHSAYLATTLLTHDPHVHEARLILVYLYMRLGLGSLAIRHFESLRVKEIQHDTIGHALFTNLAYTHPHATLLTRSESWDPGKRVRSALEMYARCEERLADCEAGVLGHGQTGMLFDLQALRDTLRMSLTRRILVLEARRIARLMERRDAGGDLEEALAQLGPLVLENWIGFEDTRDFRAAWDYGVGVERALCGADAGGDAYVLAALAADSVWSVATEGQCATVPLAALVEKLEASLPPSAAPHQGPDHRAAHLSLASLRLITTTTPTTADTSQNLRTPAIHAAARAISNLGVPAPRTTGLSLDIKTHFLYADVLRNLVALTASLAARTPDASCEEWTVLQSSATEALAAVIEHAGEMGARSKAAGFEAWREVGGGWGDGWREFLEGVVEAEREGWDGVGRIRGLG